MKIDLAEPVTEEEFEQYYRLRYERLRKPHGLPYGSERDHPAESSSTHLIAKVDGRVVGGVCWAFGMNKTASGERKIYIRTRQLAIDPDFEDLGIGIVIMRAVEKRARAAGATEIVANIRLHRVRYFEQLGWSVVGEGDTLFGTVEHLSMVKPL